MSDKSDKEKKKVLFKKICDTLEESQHSTRKHPKLLNDLKKIYYKERSSREAAGNYQKGFISLIWQAMIVPFKGTKSPTLERIISFFTEFVKSAGTLEDVERFQFPINDLRPVFIRVFQIYKNQHSDLRHPVRLRQTELMYEILKLHGTDESTTFGVDKYEELRKDLLSALSFRIQDKFPTIRSVAFKCLHFFMAEMSRELFQNVKFHAEYDPNCDARKSAFSLMCSLPSVKSSFILNKAYDREESIRIEAFKALVRVPLGRLKRDQRISILQWGLMQPAPIVKKIVLEDLLPMWIQNEACQNSIINFFALLDVGKSPRTTELVLKAMYPDDSEDTFAKVDLSFLTDKLVSLADIKLETIMYWRFLARRFHSKPYSRDKIIPGPGELIQLIYKLIEAIHEEHTQAILEDRPEDFENILCLSQILRIAELCDYEEGSRSTMESLLRNILRNQVLDEAVVIHTAVDVAHKILGKVDFNRFMMEIIQEIFEPQVEVRSNHPSQILQTVADTSRAVTIQELSPIHHSINGTPRLRDPLSVIENRSRLNNTESPSIIKSTTTNTKYLRRLTEEEIQKLKNERGELILKRHRLCDEKEKAIRKNDFLTAHQFNLEVLEVKSREEEIKKTLQDNENYEQKIPRVRSPELVRIAEDENLLLSPIFRSHHTIPHDDIDDDDNDDTIPDQIPPTAGSATIPFENRLRGIVMFTRFLTWQQELSPFSRMIYEYHACPALEEVDYRMRLHAIYIIGMVGLLDAAEAKMALAVMVNAVTPQEDDRVRAAAFKVVVDLFLHHNFSAFKITEDEKESAHLLPHPMNKFDSDTSVEEMETYLLEILDVFPGEAKDGKEQNVKHISLHFVGMMKLLIRGRITDENTISQLLIIWTDAGFTGTPLCFNIGYWIPLYASMGIECALRLASAFVTCVKGHKQDEDEEGDEMEANLDKLAGFVFTSISSAALRKFEGGSTVHAQVALQILTEINRNLSSPNNLLFGKYLKMLEINDEPYVSRIRRKVVDILKEMSYVSKKGLKTFLINFEKQLAKRFGPLPLNSPRNTDVSEMEQDEGAFSHELMEAGENSDDDDENDADGENGTRMRNLQSHQEEIRQNIDRDIDADDDEDIDIEAD